MVRPCLCDNNNAVTLRIVDSCVVIKTKRLRNKKALLLLWFLAVNYAFMCWAAMCGGRLFPHLTDLQTEFLLLGSVRAAAVMIFFVKPLKTHKEQHSYMRFAVILIIIIYTFFTFMIN